jgi:hypothetical protein
VVDGKSSHSRQSTPWLSIENVVSVSILLKRSLRPGEHESVYILSVITSRYRGRASDS